MRGEGGVRFDQSFEFQERLVVEHDAVDSSEIVFAFVKTVPNRIHRELGVMFLAGESLLLCCGHDPAAIDQCCGAIVIEG